MGGYIVFEGYDGAGKSTLIKGVARMLTARGHDVLPVGGFADGWVPSEVMSRVAMGSLPDHIAGELRFHRFKMQYQSRILPAIKANVNVLADRGAVSALWRLKCQERLDLSSQLDDVKRRPSLTVLIKTDAAICWNRICTDRTASRVETGIRRCPPAHRKDAFFAWHASYHTFCESVLEDLPHVVLDGHQEREILLGKVLSAIEPHLITLPSNRRTNGYSNQNIASGRCHHSIHNDVCLDGEGDVCEWLRSLRAHDGQLKLEAVPSLAGAKQACVRREALATALRLALYVEDKILHAAVKDADREVRRAAGSLIAVGSPSLIREVANELSVRPGQCLADFVEQLQASRETVAVEMVTEVALRFPFVLRAVALGAKFQSSMSIGMIASILLCDAARPVFSEESRGPGTGPPEFLGLGGRVSARCGR